MEAEEEPKLDDADTDDEERRRPLGDDASVPDGVEVIHDTLVPDALVSLLIEHISPFSREEHFNIFQRDFNSPRLLSFIHLTSSSFSHSSNKGLELIVAYEAIIISVDFIESVFHKFFLALLVHHVDNWSNVKGVLIVL